MGAGFQPREGRQRWWRACFVSHGLFLVVGLSWPPPQTYSQSLLHHSNWSPSFLVWIPSSFLTQELLQSSGRRGLSHSPTPDS